MEDKKTKTLFILGAGASFPYGFPLASGLRKYIIENLDTLIRSYYRGSDEWGNRLKNDKLKESKEFRKIFDLSDTQSIDLFLSRNSRFLDIGKYAIILSIIEKEKTSKFREECENPLHNWYTYLFRRMTKSMTKDEDYKNLLDNRFSFITFNYDRSLEAYLHKSYLNSFSQINPSEISVMFNNIPILHIYGSIGDLDEIPYGVNISYNSHHEKYIEIFSRIVTPYEFKINEFIKSEINTADRIFILGFSYADENMRVLNLQETTKKDCCLYCCTYGLNQIDIDEIKKLYFTGLNVKFGKTSTDSLSFLQEYLDFIEKEYNIAFLD